MVDGGVYTRRDPAEKRRTRKIARDWHRQQTAQVPVTAIRRESGEGEGRRG